MRIICNTQYICNTCNMKYKEYPHGSVEIISNLQCICNTCSMEQKESLHRNVERLCNLQYLWMKTVTVSAVSAMVPTHHSQTHSRHTFRKDMYARLDMFASANNASLTQKQLWVPWAHTAQTPAPAISTMSAHNVLWGRQCYTVHH